MLAIVTIAAVVAVDLRNLVFAVGSASVLVVKMNVKTVDVFGLERAKIAGNWLVLGMLKHVRFEIGALCERSVAMSALVWLFASVLEHVRLEMPSGSGCVIALWAGEWLIASVYADVNSQRGSVPCFIIAVRALEWLVNQMLFKMNVE